MNRNGHNNVAFFVGSEVEHSVAFSKKTLFVVGRQDVATIEKHAREHRTPHIYMGANHSFDVDFNHPDNTQHTYWDKTLTALLDKGFMVSLDYQAHLHKHVLKLLNKGVWQCRNFVPMLSVRVPHIETSNPNLTVKFDDVDFNATNPGVWCMHFHEVTDSNRFTGWGEYGSDLVIDGPAQDVVPVKSLREELIAATTDVVEDEVVLPLNNTELGLEILPEVVEEVVEESVPKPKKIKTPEDAAAVYAEGAKEDPLGAEASRKPKGKK